MTQYKRRRASRFASFLVTLAFLFAGLKPGYSQSTPPIVVFDEDDGGSVTYYDASFGTRQGNSLLTLAGSGTDKLPIITTNAVSGSHSGLLQWTSGPGGLWQLFIASPGWATRDASAYDSLVFWFNGPATVDAAALPWIGLESNTNQKSSVVNLSSYLSTGLDGDTDTWQRISIPLTAFQPYGAFLLSQFKDFWFGQRLADNVQHTIWFDDARLVGESSTLVPLQVTGLVSRSGDQSVLLHWDPDTVQVPDGFNVYRATAKEGPYAKLTSPPPTLTGWADVSAQNGTTYWYVVRAIGGGAIEGPPSDTISAMPMPFPGDSSFLDYIQRASVDYFWYEANPLNGLIRDRSQRGSPASIASMGFGLSALCVGVDRGWLTRGAVRDRVLTTLTTLWEMPQGNAVSGMIGYRGFFYHWLDMGTATRMTSWNSELSSIDTGLLLAGILDARQYFSGSDPREARIRELADSIYARVEWDWMRNSGASLTHGWYPETGFISYRWIGYNEAMILYLIAIGAPSHAIPGTAWNAWTSGYSWQTHYGQSFVVFPPLFGHQFSHCWIDFRSTADVYMAARGITYAQNTRRATLAQQAYCIANPAAFPGYGELVWGLTACDGPSGTGYFGYSARGAPPAQNDDGTIAPPAVAGSMPFAPEICLPTLRHMYDTYRTTILTPYGFCDAFNLKANWWDADVIGIDQGTVALLIENYRTGSVWSRTMTAPEIQQGLALAGFTPVVSVGEDPALPLAFSLEPNYPNPFNASTVFTYSLPASGTIRLRMFSVLGEEIATVVDEFKPAGRHTIRFDGASLASGMYIARLESGGQMQARRVLLLK